MGLGNPGYWEKAADYLKEVEFDTVQETGWSHSRFDHKKVVQSGRWAIQVRSSYVEQVMQDQCIGAKTAECTR